jgi:hypothetical protein
MEMSVYTRNEPDVVSGRELKAEELASVGGGTFWDRVIAGHDATHRGIGVVAADAALGSQGIGASAAGVAMGDR